MCDVQKHVSEAFRYLRMFARDLYEHSPSEYLAMRIGSVKSNYDEYERMAFEAIMRERAHRAKSMKASDLFKRPKETTAGDDSKEIREETEKLNDWLAGLKRKENDRKE